MRNDIGIALAALEVLLFQFLGCQAGDDVKITAAAGADKPEDLAIACITVCRGEGKVFFMASDPIIFHGTLRLVDSNFLNAAKNFVLETAEPAYRHHLHSVRKLMAYAQEVNLDAEFEKDAYRLAKERRLKQ